MHDNVRSLSQPVWHSLISAGSYGIEVDGIRKQLARVRKDMEEEVAVLR